MRPPRLSFAGAYYHITCRTNNREFWFTKDKDFELFLEKLRKAKKLYDVLVYAYSLTSNHYHLLVHTPEKDNISEFMRYLNGCFAQAYNRRYGRSGGFWADRFFSNIIDSETQLFNTIVYIDFHISAEQYRRFNNYILSVSSPS